MSGQRLSVWLRLGATSCLFALLALAFVGGCGETVQVGIDDALSLGATAGSAAGGALELGGVSSGGTAVGGAGAPGCEPTLCRGQTYQCGDCDDNDHDGLIDQLDPDCLGPCDDDEVGLSTGVAPSQSMACRQDCYFDGNNGSGNDKCQWSHSCDPLSVAPNYPPSGESRCAYGAAMGVDCQTLSVSQSTQCTDTCLPLVPNGCDCFGCCEIPGGSNNYHYIGAGRGAQGCQLDKLDDPLACPPCTPVGSCFNECGKCEACVAKPPDPSCVSGSACPNGQRQCGLDGACDAGDYCVTGCCVRAPR